MYTYHLYQKKDGKNILAGESRSPFPPDDERGQKAISDQFKRIQAAGFKGAWAVALLNKDGGKTWFNRQGQAVEENNAFA